MAEGCWDSLSEGVTGLAECVIGWLSGEVTGLPECSDEGLILCPDYLRRGDGATNVVA